MTEPDSDFNFELSRRRLLAAAGIAGGVAAAAAIVGSGAAQAADTSAAAPGATAAPVYSKEDTPWSAVRNAAHAYGFAAFTIDPGAKPGDMTTTEVTY